MAGGKAVCADIGALKMLVDNTKWLKGIREEVVLRRIQLAYSDCEKYKNEISCVSRVKRWFVSLDRAGLLRKLDKTDVESAQALIDGLSACACGECDDPHLFAISYVGKLDYILTTDGRLGRCKTKMRADVEARKYAQVRVISSEQTFKRHHERMLK